MKRMPHRYAFARSPDVPSKGTKLEVLSRIRDSIAANCEKDKKACRKLCGKSSGWVSAVYELGVVYGLRFV